MRRFLIITLLVISVICPARADLPPYEDWHPRLLCDESVLSALPDSIVADPVKEAAWQLILFLAGQYQNAPPIAVLSDNAGLTNLPAMGLVALLAEEPLASASRAKVQETVLYLVDEEGVWGSGDDLSSTLRLQALLMGYDLAFAGAAPADRESVLAEIRDYLEVMTTDFVFTCGVYNPYCSNHSIALGAVLAMADLCLEGEWPDDPLLAAARSLGDSLIDKGLADLLGEDGSYGEGGLYLAYIYRFLVPYWEAALRLEGTALWDEGKLAAVFKWTAYLLSPEGEGYFLNRNDCSESTRPLALHGTLWEWGQRCLPDPRFARWVQAHITGAQGSDFGLLADKVAVVFHHRAGEQQSPASFLPPQGFFPDQGLYVYRDSWPGDLLADSFHFSFQAGRFMGGHWQEDVGQLTLRAFGERFAMDHGSGTSAGETEAHNLPLIDGLGQHNAGEGIGTDGEMRLLLERGFCRVLRADMAPAYCGHSPFNDPDWPLPGTDWSWGYDGGNPMELADRWLLLFPPPLAGDAPSIYLLDDLRKDGEVHGMEWRLHFGSDLELAVADGLYRLEGPGGRLDARLLAPPPAETSWSVADFDNGGSDEGSRVLSVQHSAAQGRFLWRWLPRYPGQVEPPTQVEDFGIGLRVVSGAEPFLRRELLCAWEGNLQIPDRELQGRFAVIEEEGALLRHALIAGSEFWREGLLYCRLAPEASAAVDRPTVWLSAAELDFEIYAPEAVEVLAGDEPVPFTRIGDYIFDGDGTGLPPGSSTCDLPAAWTLTVREQGIGGATLRLLARGPGVSRARLEIFDVRGRRVARLHLGSLPPGGREFVWRGDAANGRRLPAGVYLARLAAGGQIASAKLILLR